MSNRKLNFTVVVEPRGSWADAKNAARATVHKNATDGEPSSEFKWAICDGEHSPVRLRTFLVTMFGIPSFVSVHLVRHKMGVEHFVSSNRPDRNGGDEAIVRWSPVTHVMAINGAALQFISRRRLCRLASPETREVWAAVVDGVRVYDPELADTCLPMCLYRGGYCHEANGCGAFPRLPRMGAGELAAFFKAREGGAA